MTAPHHAHKNAGQVARFVEHVWPKLERSGNVTDLPPMNRKAKGESDAPIGHHALVVWMHFYLKYQGLIGTKAPREDEGNVETYIVEGA